MMRHAALPGLGLYILMETPYNNVPYMIDAQLPLFDSKSYTRLI